MYCSNFTQLTKKTFPYNEWGFWPVLKGYQQFYLVDTPGLFMSFLVLLVSLGVMTKSLKDTLKWKT